MHNNELLKRKLLNLNKTLTPMHIYEYLYMQKYIRKYTHTNTYECSMYVNIYVYMNLPLFSSILFRLILYIRSRNRKTESQEKKKKETAHPKKKNTAHPVFSHALSPGNRRPQLPA